MNDSHWFGFSRTVISVAVAMAAAAPALAQNTTSAVGGRIVDAGGRPVAGATVTVRHEESGSTNTTTSDADGRYALRGLRVGGPYTVTFMKDGQSDKREGVFLVLAETLALDGTIGAGTATVVVTGQSTAGRFGSASMGAGTNIGSRELNSLATISRSLTDFARTDPRLSQTDKERGEISAAGQNVRFNSITIDGVTINDTFGLKPNNLPTLKQPISIDTIQSVQVNISNYDVTQKGYTGANINAVTKSGTNEFAGILSYAYRDEQLTGDRFNRTNETWTGTPGFKEELKSVTLSGPIIKDKLFFLVNYEELESTRGAPDFGPLGDAKTNVGITPAAISQTAAIAQNNYGLNIGSASVPGGAQTLVTDTLVKLDWNISDNHRANVRYTKTEQTDPQLNNINGGALSFDSNWHDQADNIETAVVQWFADWTSNFSTELKVSRRDYESFPTFPFSSPQVGLNFTGALPAGTPSSVATNRTLFFGTERSRHFNELRTKTDDLYLGATWNAGAHEIKFGGDVSDNEIFNAFLQDTFGNYTFRCISSSPTFTYNSLPGGINCNAASTTAAQIEAAILENFQRGRPSSYQVQAPAPGQTIADGAARWSLKQTGLFVQDTWKLSKNLTITGGVRVDEQSAGEKPLFNAAAAAPTVAGNAATGARQSGGFGLDNSETLDGERLVQPRFGFNYAFDRADKRRMQLRGGFGLFQGAAASVWLSNPYSNTGVATRIVGCGIAGYSACPGTDGLFSADPANQPTSFPGNPPAANVDFIAKDLGQPAVWKMNLAFDTELPWGGLVAGAEWLHTKTKQGIYYQHLNLGAPTLIGPDGRELFYTAQGYNTACWGPTGSNSSSGACTGFRSRALNNPAYNNVLLASKTSEGGGDALTLSLSAPASTGWGWQAAYTRTRAKEVSPLTSSVSNSNWAGRSVFNPNEEVTANATALVRDRVSAALTWARPTIAGKYRTSIGLFYEGRTGKPYSWTYFNDMNGDGLAGNDLLYVPSAPGSGEVVFLGATPEARAAQEAAFWNVVHTYPELTRSRGGVVKRNGSFSSFTNSFDLRISQELPGFMAGHKGMVMFDILNLGNMLDRRWGRIDEIAFQSNGGPARSFVNYVGMQDGKYVYSVVPLEDLTTKQARGESQWAVQVTLKYEF
jgi:hypothetical protein